MAEQTRKSVFALVEETTEGTAKFPTASTDYIALQDGFEVTPSFETLENAELTGSIGGAKDQIGFETPSASISHYLRHSGVEGQEPNFGKVFDALLGDKSVAGTEYDTIAGSTAGTASTRGTVVVDSGEGVNFERGQGLLIKDGTNGYSIRNVQSVSTDTLSLNFNLANAPASGVNLGQAVLYKPADEGHATFTGTWYKGNGAAIEQALGLRPTSATINVSAGEYVNCDFSFEGIQYNFDPIEITATNKFVDFNDGSTQAASIAEKTYRDPHELAAALQTAMDAQSSDTITVTYSDTTGKYTLASDGVTFELEWSTGTNAANTIGDTIGFDTSADDTGSTSYEGDDAIDLTSPQTASFDDANPLVAKAQEVLLGDFDDIGCASVRTATITINGTKQDLFDVCAESGKEGSLIAERTGEITLEGTYDKYDADKFRRFRAGENIQFAYNFGEKSGGNWVAGKSGNFYVPTATITNFSLPDNSGVVEFSITLVPYVEDGLGEMYLNFL